MPALLHERPCGFHAQLFDGFGRGLAGLRPERPAELSRTEVCRFGKLRNAEGRVEVLPRVRERRLNAV